MVDFDQKLGKEKAARLEEALLHMGILDALIIAPQYREQVLQSEEGCCDRYLFTDAEYVRNNLMDWLDIDNPDHDMFLYQNISGVLSAITSGRSDQQENSIAWIRSQNCSSSWTRSKKKSKQKNRKSKKSRVV